MQGSKFLGYQDLFEEPKKVKEVKAPKEIKPSKQELKSVVERVEESQTLEGATLIDSYGSKTEALPKSMKEKYVGKK